MSMNEPIHQDQVNQYGFLLSQGLVFDKIRKSLKVNHRRMERIKDKYDYQVERKLKAMIKPVKRRGLFE